ncbi:MAG TPA: DUF1294 domain-containing protein, partial [Candidatus Absconditabacterales bacterium]|nr:DUF1294 domain-containing protein [Candidatus Absconditabacterales bacterium]
GKWRFSEKQLLILVGLGGFVGSILGMQIFRHKTIKSKFLYWFRGIVFIQLALLVVLMIKG